MKWQKTEVTSLPKVTCPYMRPQVSQSWAQSFWQNLVPGLRVVYALGGSAWPLPPMAQGSPWCTEPLHSRAPALTEDLADLLWWVCLELSWEIARGPGQASGLGGLVLTVLLLLPHHSPWGS